MNGYTCLPAQSLDNDTMSVSHSIPLRPGCPPGSCVCGRERLFDDPHADVRILRMTQEEEKRLIARIEAISSYADLLHVADRMRTQMGIVLHVAPGGREVRTVRGLQIRLEDQPGLCRKTRQSIPAAIRRCLERHPRIVYDLLDSQGLLGPA